MLDTQIEPEEVLGSTPEQPRGAWIAVLFVGTSLLGAALLFMVQPLAAKLILPSYGGSATVWSTSSLFFQVLLLVGYVYAHVSSRRLGAWWQPRVHLLVLLVPVMFLPVALPVDAAPAADTSPTLWLLRTLTLMIGVPYLVLSATGPLIQRWYAWSRGPRAEDPYFLFAGSNLGSFIGLLCYPFVVEPLLTLPQQRWMWTIGLGVFLALMATCALVVRAPRQAVGEKEAATEAEAAPPASQVIVWCALAFLPSCLMLAVTAHISTDVAPIPLVWVLPLAVYLASFIAAFARRSRQAPVTMTRAAVVSAVLSTVLVRVGPSGLPVTLVVLVDLVTVALVGYAAHARLAASRPGTDHLTGFYLVISVGGALGGLVNGVLAPAVLNRVWEHGLSLAAVPLLMIGLTAPTALRFGRRYHPAFRIVIGVVLATPVVVALSVLLGLAAGLGTVAVCALLLLAAPVGWVAARTPLVLAFCVLVVMLSAGAQVMASSMAMTRTFYGSYRLVDQDGSHQLIHGTTVHGTQLQDDRRDVPTAYYAEDGPLGDALGEVTAGASAQRVGVVGLGAGAIAAYGRAGDRYTFFEIDPTIRDIAEDPDYFTYVADSAAEVDVVVGDGRLRMAEQPAGGLDLIVLDAFSSDSIPVHLLTAEAMEEYATRLAPGGSLVVHITNRVFDLEPVLTAASRDLGWVGVRGTGGGGPGSLALPSTWAVITPDAALAGRLLDLPGWAPLDSPDPVTWTDDYASVLSVLK